jgi:hypothetical protein
MPFEGSVGVAGPFGGKGSLHARIERRGHRIGDAPSTAESAPSCPRHDISQRSGAATHNCPRARLWTALPSAVPVDRKWRHPVVRHRYRSCEQSEHIGSRSAITGPPITRSGKGPSAARREPAGRLSRAPGPARRPWPSTSR